MNTFLSSQQKALLEDYKSFAKSSLNSINESFVDDASKVKGILEIFGQKGYLGICIPAEYGGKGEPFLNLALFIEAISYYDAGLALAVASHVAVSDMIVKYGSDTQKSRYLPLMARAEKIGAVAFGEEPAGSDFKGIATTFECKDSKIKVNGKKTWIVNGDIADLALVSGVFSEGEKTWFAHLLVDTENKSLKVSPLKDKLGLKLARTNDIEINDLEVEEKAIIGAESFEQLKKEDRFDEMSLYSMDITKLVVSASAIGLLNFAVDNSVERARTREQFGANIGKQQAIQWKLADMSAESAAAKLLVYRAAWSKDEEPESFRKNAAMSKFYAARAARVHSSEAVQIFGAMGISVDDPVEKLYRDAKVMEIAEGTSEIQKNIIAQEIGS